MTTGNKVDDRRSLFQRDATLYPQGFYYPGTSELAGAYYSRSWTGTDRPKVKKLYERNYLRLRDGRLISFRRRINPPVIKRLKDDPHPYDVTYTYTRSSGYEQRWSYTDGTLHQVNHEIAAPYTLVDASSEWTTNDTIATIGKLRNEIAGSDFNAAVFLGEGREALAMITNSAVRIRKALTSLKRGNFAAVASALEQPDLKRKLSHKKAFAGNWLAAQYGWFPLVKDAQNGAEYLARFLEFPFVQRYKVRKTKPLKVTTNTSQGMSSFAYGYTRTQIVAYVREVNEVQLSGLTDPASLLWELTPYSFVADWFIPIGNYLAARSLSQAVAGTFVTTKTRKVATQYIQGPYSNASGVFTFSNAQAEEKLSTTTRTVSTTLDVPLPSWKPLSSVASWQHCANAVALLVSGFGSRSGTRI